MSEHPLFAFEFDNHIFYDLSPLSLAGMKCEMYEKMMHVCKLKQCHGCNQTDNETINTDINIKSRTRY